MSRRRLMPLPFVALLALAACGSNDTESPAAAASPVTSAMSDDAMSDDAMSEDSMTDDAMSDDAMTDDAMSDDAMSDDAMSDDAMTEDSMHDDSMMELAAFQQLQLTDVDGQTFTLGDFVGTPVFVENFATWCPNCRRQLGETNAAAEQLGESAVFIALSTETELSSSDVAEYAADNGFDSIRFAVMTPEFLAAMAEAYGNSAVNPPSTPHFVIDADGLAGDLNTGSESPDEIVATMTAASS
jgi:pentapeptide MXKDX repeat protein